MADRQVEGSQRNEELGVPDDVALDVGGEEVRHAAVHRESDVAAPSAGLGQLVGQVLRPGQPGADRVAVGRVESAVIARDLVKER